MVYYNKDSASDLKPILLVVSVITAIIFGAGYFAYSSSNHNADANAATAAPEAPPASSSTGHSHV